MNREFDIVFGIHSINEAIKNRSSHKLYCTKESKKNFKTNNIEMCDKHKVQQLAVKYSKELGYDVERAPSNAFLKCSPLKILSGGEVFKDIEKGFSGKILVLDQVTDVHNIGAILRTSSFFDVKFVVISQKGLEGFSPAFYRISSGAAEFVKIINVSNLSKFISNLNEKNVLTVGFDESGEPIGPLNPPSSVGSTCIVMGSEDRGISHAVSRNISKIYKMESMGPIQTLNVSVATAIALEKIFGTTQTP